MTGRWSWMWIAPLLAGTAPAGATEARRAVLGSAGLIRDERSDLDMNPAFAAAFRGGRLYTRLAGSYTRFETLATSGNSVRRTSSFDSEVFFLGGDVLRWGASAGHGGVRNTFKSSTQNTASTLRGPAEGKLLLARPVGSRALVGADVSFADEHSRDDAATSANPLELHGTEYVARLGWIGTSADASRRMGLVITGRRVGGGFSGLANGDSLLHDGSLTLLPEWRLSSPLSFRALASFSYGRLGQELENPAHYDLRRKIYSAEAGVGAELRLPSRALLTAQLTEVYDVVDTDARTATLVRPIKDRAHTAVLRLGGEQPVLRWLTIRGGFDALRYRNAVFRDAADSGRTVQAQGPVSGFVAGLSLHKDQSFQLDLQIGDLSWRYDVSKDTLGALSTLRRSFSPEAAIDATWRF